MTMRCGRSALGSSVTLSISAYTAVGPLALTTSTKKVKARRKQANATKRDIGFLCLFFGKSKIVFPFAESEGGTASINSGKPTTDGKNLLIFASHADMLQVAGIILLGIDGDLTHYVNSKFRSDACCLVFPSFWSEFR